MTVYRVSRLAVHRLACAGLTFWSLGFIVGIFMMVMRTEDKHHRDALRRYGYFYIGLEPSFWWWDIVRSLCSSSVFSLDYEDVIVAPLQSPLHVISIVCLGARFKGHRVPWSVFRSVEGVLVRSSGGLLGECFGCHKALF